MRSVSFVGRVKCAPVSHVQRLQTVLPQQHPCRRPLQRMREGKMRICCSFYHTIPFEPVSCCCILGSS